MLAAFCFVETQVADPMFRLPLFKIRAFAAGNLASCSPRLGRGGLQFMLIIWLQGIWLPLHGYSFAPDPFVGGHLHAAPDGRIPHRRTDRGLLSDRYGARPFATAGMLASAASVPAARAPAGRLPLPRVRDAPPVIGLSMGLFASPNRAGIMNSLPPGERGAGAGMTATFQNSAMVLSIGIFFTLIILGLAASLPAALYHGLIAQASRPRTRPRSPTCRRSRPLRRASRLQPDPDPARPGPRPPAAQPRRPPDRPRLLPGADLAGVLERPVRGVRLRHRRCLIAALASLLRGKRYVHEENLTEVVAPAVTAPGAAPAAVGDNGSIRTPSPRRTGGPGPPRRPSRGADAWAPRARTPQRPVPGTPGTRPLGRGHDGQR